MKKRGKGESKPQDPVSCETCGKKFKQVLGLRYHVSKKVCTPDQRDESTKIPCEKCGKKFNTKGGLEYHQKKDVCTRKAVVAEEKIAAVEAAKAAKVARAALEKRARRRRREQQTSDGECAASAKSTSKTKDGTRRKGTKGLSEKTENLIGYRVTLTNGKEGEDDTTPDETAAHGTIVHEDLRSRVMGRKVFVVYDNGDSGWMISTRKGFIILRSQPRVTDDILHTLQEQSQDAMGSGTGDDNDSDISSDDDDSSGGLSDECRPRKRSASLAALAARRVAKRQRRSKYNEVKLRAQRKATADRFPASFADAVREYKQGGFISADACVHPELACRIADVEVAQQTVADMYLPGSVHVKMRFNKSLGNPITLAPFQSARVSTQSTSNNDVVVNASGMVQSMDWCPTPDRACNKAYLAVATDSASLWQRGANTITDCTTGPSCIQFWGVGASMAIALEMVLCLDGGSVKALQWCPNGGYERGPPRGNQLLRLGLLAVATLNKVVVYAVPRPDSLKELAPGAPKHIRLKPVAEFVDGVAAVTALAWSKDPGCALLASGCEHGTLAIYNVADGHQNDDVVGDNTSGISPPVLVAPVRVLLGLPACVTSIAWCPHDASLIAVGGHTDVVQVWDLPTGSCLEQIYKVPQPYARRTKELLWPRARNGVFVVDEHPAVRFCDFSSEDIRLHRTIHFAGDAMTATMQEMLGVFVAGSDDGALISSLSPKMDGFDSFSLIGNAGNHHLARFVATEEPEDAIFTRDGATPQPTSDTPPIASASTSTSPARAPRRTSSRSISAAAVGADTGASTGSAVGWGDSSTVHVHLLTEDLAAAEYKTLLGRSLGPLRKRGCTLNPGCVPRRQQNIIRTVACPHAVAGQFLLATANATGVVLVQDLAPHETQLFHKLRTEAGASKTPACAAAATPATPATPASTASTAAT